MKNDRAAGKSKCMRLLRIGAFSLALVSVAVVGQQPQTSININEVPPEAIPAGTCKASYSGYLEVPEHKKIKNMNFTNQQIGDYVNKRLGEGYSLALYPQASGRLFIIETCLARN